MLSREDLCVLIVGYQRPDSIEQIMRECVAAGIRRIYVSIDAPKNGLTDAVERNQEIRDICSEFKANFDLISERFLDANIGCSANLLSSCDWVFENEEFVAVLEDDCIPSEAFFQFISQSLPLINLDPETLLVCGTQFVPQEIVGQAPFKSKYSLTWGWATTSDKWKLIRSEIFSSIQSNFSMKPFSMDFEEIYWLEGARRAAQGYVDVWDTVLVNFLVSKKFFALLPNQNLVTNVGNDGVATHTGKDKKWLNEPIGRFENESIVNFQENSAADIWLKNNFYGIKFRHLFSTRVTRCEDWFKKPKFLVLSKRWINARSY